MGRTGTIARGAALALSLSLFLAPAVPATAQSGPAVGAEPRIELSVSQRHNAAGQNVVTVRLRADLHRGELVSVFRRPGHGPCPADPQRIWPAGTAQLLFGARPGVDPFWQPAVRFIATGAGPAALCGYALDEENPLLDLPLVVARTGVRMVNRPPRAGAPRPEAGRFSRCAPGRARGTVFALVTRGPATPANCARARGLVRIWTERFLGFAGGPRDNWGRPYVAPDGGPLRDLADFPVRFETIPVPALRRAIDCRETVLGVRPLRLRVDCPQARFRIAPVS